MSSLHTLAFGVYPYVLPSNVDPFDAPRHGRPAELAEIQMSIDQQVFLPEEACQRVGAHTIGKRPPRCRATGRGRTHIYLVLLDYADSRPDPYGVYVGMSRYRAAQRFDQHKAGIRAAGSVLKRGLEVLTGPVLHLQFIPRAEAARIEEELAEALRAAGLLVKGGH